MKKDGKISVIEWVDSCSLRGGTWHAHDDAMQLTVDTCRSIGWVLKEDKEAIVLVPHTATHSVGGEMCIPKSAITKRWTLTDPGRKRVPR